MHLQTRLRQLLRLDELYILQKHSKYVLNFKSDVLWCWHHWRDYGNPPYHVLFLALKHGRFDIILHLQCDLDESYIIHACYYGMVDALRYMIENGIKEEDTYMYKRNGFFECMKKYDMEYRQLISRYAPQHFHKIKNVWEKIK